MSWKRAARTSALGMFGDRRHSPGLGGDYSASTRRGRGRRPFGSPQSALVTGRAVGASPPLRRLFIDDRRRVRDFRRDHHPSCSHHLAISRPVARMRPYVMGGGWATILDRSILHPYLFFTLAASRAPPSSLESPTPLCPCTRDDSAQNRARWPGLMHNYENQRFSCACASRSATYAISRRNVAVSARNERTVTASHATVAPKSARTKTRPRAVPSSFSLFLPLLPTLSPSVSPMSCEPSGDSNHTPAASVARSTSVWATRAKHAPSEAKARMKKGNHAEVSRPERTMSSCDACDACEACEVSLRAGEGERAGDLVERGMATDEISERVDGWSCVVLWHSGRLASSSLKTRPCRLVAWSTFNASMREK
ncbi:unnamed protein product [Cutaneotrichosporon oleaginosum]